MIAEKTRYAQEEVVKKANEIEEKNNNLRRERDKKENKKKVDNDANERELQRETAKLIDDLRTAASKDGSDFGKAVLDVLNNYQGIYTTSFASLLKSDRHFSLFYCPAQFRYCTIKIYVIACHF